MNVFASLHGFTDWGLLALRLALAATFLAHGRMKFGMWKMQPNDQMSAGRINLMRLLSVCETLGAVALLVGFLTQLAALGLAIIMLGALNLKIRTMKAGFVVRDKPGWEFELLILAMAVALLFTGAGTFALDRVWFAL